MRYSFKKYLIILLLIFFITILLLLQTKELFRININKTIWILWLQGEENIPWLSKQVIESWKINNKNWKVELLTLDNLNTFLPDLTYIHKDGITPQAKSDIIRLSILSKYGGIWADASLLCMQPLDNWIDKYFNNENNFWMYHGTGGGMDITKGPASWFMISCSDSIIIDKWKKACDNFWKTRDNLDSYFTDKYSIPDYYWMDGLFRELYENDSEFKKSWDKVPALSCEDYGQSHSLAGKILDSDEKLKDYLKKNRPFVLKLCNKAWSSKCLNQNTDECKNTTTYYAIQLSKEQS
jgi:hypothetical protein